MLPLILLLISSISADFNIPTVLLKNAAQPGTYMPVVGLGTGGDIPSRSNISHPEFWNNSIGYNATYKWFNIGGRSWDAAITYESELGVGTALLELTNNYKTISRNNIWITSKIGPWAPMGYEETFGQFQNILNQFKTNYIDLILIHWPSDNTTHSYNSTDISCNASPNNLKNYSPSKCRQNVWKALESLYNSKKIKSIGVSNFEEKHLNDIFELNSLKPSVNQFEFHGYWHEYNLVKFCQNNNIIVNTYAPLGTPDVMNGVWPILLTEHPIAIQIGNKYNKTASQIWLRWAIEQGMVINPRTENIQHMKENLDIFDFQLNQEDMLQLASIQPPKNPKVTPDPNYMN